MSVLGMIVDYVSLPLLVLVVMSSGHPVWLGQDWNAEVSGARPFIVSLHTGLARRE